MAGTAHAETAKGSHPDQLRVVIVGGGVAALEAVLALADLGRDRINVTVIAPNTEFVYRPMVVREPFARGSARRYPLAPIVRDAGATLLPGELGWIDPVGRTIHTKAGEAIEYDALVLALGASINKRYKHALTIDDRDLDETMHGLIQDVEGGFIHKLAFVTPGRMAWPLPLYELALMTAGRAYDTGIDLETTIVTPEDCPLAIFGASASSSIAELLVRASIKTITSAYAEVPTSREVVINPGDRHLEVDRVIALPELFGPAVRGIPLGDHGFIQVDPYCRVPGVEQIYAAGDATDFPIKHGGIGSQQADIAAQSIAALAGASVTPQRFNPMIHGMLLTDGKPQYLTAHITGGHGFSSEFTDTPTWSPPSKIAAKYLAPYLQERDRGSTTT
ncbi:MAG TPA: FAD-dependent oxidoreductase [Solirubrobacteraceae bacterium]|jgi:sulfide:quinone oxidoreductase|nr:FAD-dependent oxidoreductase [Solirubrobacteraceae bacterium]